MPRINIHVTAEDSPLDQQVLDLDVSAELSLAEFKSYVQAETNFAPERQSFYLDGRPLLNDRTTLRQAGVKDGDMLAVLIVSSDQAAAAAAAAATNRPQQAQRSARPSNGMPPPDQIERTRQGFLNNPQALAQFRQSNPALAEAVNDPVRFREAFEELVRSEGDRERERQNQMRLLNEDPFNIEAQKKIEELIRQDRVMENLQYAYDNNPEVFGRVTMLYINCQVNRHPIKAFVDSGAQTTIMSPSCAEACGIMRLVDTRYSGIARGVGTAQILGRVHSADMTIGNLFLPCSFTVMEGKDVDLLLGLDMLKRYQATIDLKRNKLVFENEEVDFLGESEIPKWMEEAQDAEPTVQGPNGTRIGAQSGTVKSTASSRAGNFKGVGQTVGSAPEPSVQPTPMSTGASSTAPSSTPSSSHPKESIDQLVSLGFSGKEAIAALNATGGNVEYAANLLFQS